MKPLRRWIIAIAIAVPLIGLVAWFISGEFATGLLTLLSTTATAIMAATVYQLDLSIQQLRFDALSQTYDYLNEKIKSDLDEAARWAREELSVSDVVDDQNRREALRNGSIALNKVGYLVYKGLLDVSFVQEEFGGLVVRSFVAMRPYLQALREESEPSDQPWFMRRFLLLIAVACDRYLQEQFPEYRRQIIEQYGRHVEHLAQDAVDVVPLAWLSEDVKTWLRGKGLIDR
ncbi:MAG: hypothetical protein KatS3mg011_2089 [Acidimicrobiia bacterium]|nr:MAG: hypothetical protein KatS3mg011_2089 [Acidimicrobiia bacterium]